MYGQIKIPPEKNAPQSLHGEDQGVISDTLVTGLALSSVVRRLFVPHR